MNRSSWSNWMYRLFKNSSAKKAHRVAPRRLQIEHLEDRVVPAITITDASTTGGATGTLDLDLLADGIVSSASGTISRAALTSVAATTDISITCTSGDITFDNFASTVTLLTGGGHTDSFITSNGSITFTDPTDIFATSGGSLIFTAGGSGKTLSLASLSGSGLSASADGNIDITSMNSTGAITATSTSGHVNSTSLLQTPGQLTLGADTGIDVKTSAATLQAQNGTSGDIVVTQSASPQQLLTITNTGGGVVNSANGGKITITNLGNGIALNPSAIVQSKGGDITLKSKDIVIDSTATINANNGTNAAGGGIVTLAPTDGTQVDLGTNTNGKYSLTQAEIDRVTGSNLRIGSSASGTFTVTAAINATAAFNNTLTLISGAAMTDTGAGAIAATNLRLSGTGPVLLDGNNNVANLVADLSGAGGSLQFNDGTNTLTVGASIDGVTGIATNNSDVTLSADNLNIANTINVGTARTLLLGFTVGRNVDLGTETAGKLSLTDTELDRVTAGIIQISGGGGVGDITVTDAISPANAPTLELTTNGDITDTAAGSIVVTNLVAASTSSVVLDNAANDVDSLAGAITSGGGPFTFVDADGFVVDTIDGTAGITGGSLSTISLTAGGAVTQTAGSSIFGQELELLGTGPYTLTDAGNDVAVLAANLTASGTGALSYKDANDLLIATAGSTLGVTTNDSDITIATVDGDLTIENDATGTDIDAGAGAVSLTAGSATGTDSLLDLQNNGGSGIIGTGGVTLTADHISLAGTVNAGTNTAILQPFEAGTLIDLGGADGSNTLGLTTTEINNVTAGVIVVGNSTAGDLTITADITPTGTSQLELETGGNIVDTAAKKITVANLGMTAGGNIGSLAAPIFTSVNNLEASAGGAVVVNNDKALNIGGVNNTLTGVQSTGSGGDGVAISALTTLTVSEAVAQTGGDNLVLLAGTDLTVNKTVTASGGSGVLGLAANGSVFVNAAVANNGTGDLVANFDYDNNFSGDFTSTAGGTLATQGGNLKIVGGQANTANEGLFGNSVTIGDKVTVTGGSGDVIVSTGRHVDVNAAVRVTGTGDILITTDSNNDNSGHFTSAVGGTLRTASGDIAITGGSGASAGKEGSQATVGGAVTIDGGAGSVSVSYRSSVTVNAAVDVGGTGGINLTADGNADDFGRFTTGVGGILKTAGGDIVITGADAILGAAINATTNATSRVEFHASTTAKPIHVGSNTAFGLTDAELDLVTAGVLQIGDTSNTGGIAIDPPTSGTVVTIDPMKVATLSLITDGAITNTNPDGADLAPTLTVKNLFLRAGTGIGQADDLDISATNLAIDNVTSGAVIVSNVASVLNITTVDGFDGAVNAGSGQLRVTNRGGPLNVLQKVLGSGGGDVFLGTFGANGDITVANTASVTASGGDGDITLDASNATSGGQITVNDGPNAADISAAGFGDITLLARTGVTVNASAVIQSGTSSTGGGDITLKSNVGQPNGTADIVLGSGVQILTLGDITLDANPDNNTVGGGINMAANSVLAGPGGTQAFDITLNAGKNITVRSLDAANNIIVTSVQNIFDDNDDGTILNAGNNIYLTAGGRIGGQATATPITTGDIESFSTGSPSANYLAMVDVDYGNQLILAQTGALGNIQIRKVGGGLNTSSVFLNSNPLVGTGNQLALVSEGGDLTIDNNFTLNGSNNANLFLATSNGDNVVIKTSTSSTLVNNGATSTTTLMAGGSNTANISGEGADGNADLTVQNLVLVTTGGDIGSTATPLEFNAVTLGGFTTGKVNAVAQDGGSAYLTDTANGIAVAQFNAGKGDVTLVSNGLIPNPLVGAGSSVVAVNANDGVAEIIGNNITIDTSGAPQAASSGNVGQIGFASAGVGQFFEVSPGTNGGMFKATTADSQVWLSFIGGGTIDTIDVGTNTARIKAVNGDVIGSHSTGAADILAATQTVLTGESGGFGQLGNRLQTNSPLLSASVTGTGDIHVLGLAGTGLTVSKATTANGMVDIGALNGGLQIGTSAATVASALSAGGTGGTNGTVFLNTSNADITFVTGAGVTSGTIASATGLFGLDAGGGGKVVSSTAAGVTDVSAGSVGASAGAGIGTNANPFELATAMLGASAAITGGVFVNNTNASLDINLVSGVLGVSAAAGDIKVTTSGSMTVSEGVSGDGDVTLSSVGNLSTSADVSTTGGSIDVTATGGAVDLGGDVTASVDVTVKATDLNSTLVFQNISLDAGKTVSSTGGGDVKLLAGDNITVDGSISTTGDVTLTADNGNADTVGGAAIQITGTTGNTVSGDNVFLNGGSSANTFSYAFTLGSQTAVTGTTSVVLTGNGGADTFNVTPQAAGQQIQVAGLAPTTPPGDKLNVTGDTGTTLDATGVGNGTLSFTNGGDITYTSIETLSTATALDLVFDLNVLGFQNATPDSVIVSTTPGLNPTLNVTVNGVSIYSGLAADVNSLEIDGSTDAESFLIDQTNPGVPTTTVNGNAPTTAPGDTLVVNPTNAGTVTFTPGAAGAGTFNFTARNSVSFTGIETVTTNVISIAATDPTAAETGVNQTPDTATFTLTRTGSTANALTVNVLITGTAKNGIDYQSIPATATFAAGSSTAVIVINPINNSLIDGTRTVTITVLPGAAYSVGMVASASATIADNDTVSQSYATGSAVGGVVTLTNGSSDSTATFTPFPGFTGAINVATGDVNGDGIADYAITGGVGGPSVIELIDGATGAIINIIPVLGGAYLGGLSVAIGDVDGDGVGEVIIGLMTGLPAVGIFNGMTGELITAFIAFPTLVSAGPDITAFVGVNVAVGDLDGDGKDEIVVTPRGIAPLVSIYDGKGNQLFSFLAFSPALGSVGLTVAVGDLNGDGLDEIITGAFLPQGTVLPGTYVLTFNGKGVLQNAFAIPTIPSTAGAFGPPVAAADFNGDGVDDLFVSDGPFLAVFDGLTGAILSVTIPFPGNGGAFVA